MHGTLYNMQGNMFKDVPTRFYLLNVHTINSYKDEVIFKHQTEVEGYNEAKLVSEMGLERLINILDSEVKNSNHQYEAITSFDTVLSGVEETVEKKDIDFVFMGTKGKSDPINRLYGSITVEVMEHLQQCPLIVVPKNIGEINQVPEKVNEIVFATDYKYYYKKSEINNLIEISLRLKAPIRILHVSEGKGNLSPKQEEHKEILKSLLEQVVATFHTLTQGKVSTGINSFIESRGSSFLALYRHREGKLSEFFTTSLASKIVFNPKLPVLILKKAR